jgi:hypothetical protein
MVADKTSTILNRLTGKSSPADNGSPGQGVAAAHFKQIEKVSPLNSKDTYVTVFQANHMNGPISTKNYQI